MLVLGRHNLRGVVSASRGVAGCLLVFFRWVVVAAGLRTCVRMRRGAWGREGVGGLRRSNVDIHLLERSLPSHS